MRRSETFTCPTCGADVLTNARACPECGADDETGWSQDTMYDDLDLPDTGDEKSDYDPETDDRKSTTTLWIILGAIAAIVAMLVLMTRR